WLSAQRGRILDGTLIRRLETNLFDCTNLRQHLQAALQPVPGAEGFSFILPARQLPSPLPEHWRVSEGPDVNQVRVNVTGPLEALLRDHYESPVKCAGQLPSGFLPAGLYP